MASIGKDRGSMASLTGAALFLAAILQAAQAVNPYCDNAYFWYPDGSRVQGNTNWAEGPYFFKGPCLQVSGIGITQTMAKTVLIIDRTDYKNTYMIMPGTDGGLAFAEEVKIDDPAIPQRALNVITNTFCSSGQHVAGGKFFSIGGDQAGGGAGGGGGYIAGKGGFSMRAFTPCRDDKCDFTMDGQLNANRWYPTTQLLGDGRMMVVGGSNAGVAINGADQNVPSLEYYPDKTAAGLVNVDFLTATLPYNLYPYVHLLPNGQVFIFSANQYILWDTTANQVAAGDFPALKKVDDAGNDIMRSYPLAGTSAMLMLSPKTQYEAEIMICGGAPTTAYVALGNENAYAPSDNMCWRIQPLAAAPEWVGETMKLKRVLPVCSLLPDGTLFIHGGAATGHSGIPDAAHNASLSPEIYNGVTHTWYAGPLGTSLVPRVYHASSILLHDSSVFISGSNPHQDVIDVIGDDYPTELRTEIYQPPYFRSKFPPPVMFQPPAAITLGKPFFVGFKSPLLVLTKAAVSVVLSQPGFSTHGNNHGMRMVELQVLAFKANKGVYVAEVVAPANKNLLSPTFYWIFVVVNGVPNREGHHVIVD